MDLISREPEIEKRNGKSAQNVPKEDLISRKAAIEALDSINCCGYVEEPWDIVRGIIERVPAAELEKRTEERTETNACDSISRRAAIKEAVPVRCEGDVYMMVQVETLEGLPSVEPDISEYSDKLWHTAYERGRAEALAERKTGQWVHDGKEHKAGTDWMHCSECGYKTVWSGACMTPYCPWCGAFMGGDMDGDMPD